MKKLLFILPFLALSLFLNASNSKKQAIQAINDYKTFLEYWHHTCSGTSGFGGSCSATCQDACNCQCNTSFWTCSCTCSCGDNQTSIQSIDPGPKSNWKLMKSILQKEKTDLAKQLSRKVMDLYKLGIENKAKEYNELGAVMDKDMMNLNPETLRKIASAFS